VVAAIFAAEAETVVHVHDVRTPSCAVRDRLAFHSEPGHDVVLS
jgi:hypothetical protein